MSGIVHRLIEQGRYEVALMEANFGHGYWPDERYESARNNVRECLEFIELDKARRKRDIAGAGRAAP